MTKINRMNELVKDIKSSRDKSSTYRILIPLTVVIIILFSFISNNLSSEFNIENIILLISVYVLDVFLIVIIGMFFRNFIISINAFSEYNILMTDYENTI